MWKNAREAWRSHKTTMHWDQMPDGGLSVFWLTGRSASHLVYIITVPVTRWSGRNMQHLNAQTCVKTLEMLNERTQLPAPLWHSVFTAPCAALLVCQGAAGVGLPRARAQPTAPAHGEWGRDGSRDWGQLWPSWHPHTALFLGAGPRLAPSQTWTGPLAAGLLSGERRLQSKLGSLEPKLCGY